MFERALTVTALAMVALAGAEKANAQFIDPCRATVTVNPGTVVVCPKGDGDPLTTPIGGGNSQISLTVRYYGGFPADGIPAEDMWLVGCSNGLLLCGLSSGSNADAPTNAQGQTTFSNEPIAGGCDSGLNVVVQGVIMQNPTTCQPLCIPIETRSPDYKSAGAPGPAPCAGDVLCPDSRVTNADFSWFVTHYPSAANPGAPYFACADFAAPLGGVIGLADFSKFVVHFSNPEAGHKCPI